MSVDAEGQPIQLIDETGEQDMNEEFEVDESGMPKQETEEEREILDSDVEVPTTPDGLPIDHTVEHGDSEEQVRTRRFATITNLVNSVLGAGMLGVTNSMKGCGYVIGSILIIVVALLNHFGSILTIKLQYRTKAEGFDELAKIVLGRWGSYALSISLLVFCYSCLVAYLVIAGDNYISWFDLAGVKITGKGWRMLIVAVNALVVPIPLTIPKSLKFLSYFAFINLVCVILFFIVMVIKAIQLLPKQGLGPNVVAVKGGMGLFSAVAVYSLTFCLPSVILPLIKTYNPDLPKRGVVTLWAIGICAFVVLVPGVLGYLILGDNSKGNILVSFPSNDVLMVIVRIAFYFVTSCSYPAVCKSVMSSWSMLFYNENEPNFLPKCKRAFIIILSNIIPLIIAMILPNITPALSIGGALGGALSSFFFPPLIWVVLSKKSWKTPRNLGFIAYTIFGFIIVCICTYQSVVDAIKAFSE
jgi:amino acid permease